MPHNIIVGQKVTAEKKARAKELRQAMTPEEWTLWQVLRNNRHEGLRFRRQQVIDGFIVDFYCHQVGLVIEVDGDVHEAMAARDRERDEIISQQGICVMRVTNAEVRYDLVDVVQRIRTICRERLRENE